MREYLETLDDAAYGKASPVTPKFVAPSDPGVGNWIDTGGHRHGTMGLRYNQVAEDLPPTVRVVPLADLSRSAGSS